MGNAHQRNHCPHCPYRTTVPCCCTKQLQNAIQGPLANDQGFHTHTHTRALTQTSMQTEPNKDRQRERERQKRYKATKVSKAIQSERWIYSGCFSRTDQTHEKNLMLLLVLRGELRSDCTHRVQERGSSRRGTLALRLNGFCVAQRQTTCATQTPSWPSVLRSARCFFASWALGALRSDAHRPYNSAYRVHVLTSIPGHRS